MMHFNDFKILKLTDRAAEQAKKIIADADQPKAGLRIGIKNAGCVGVSYTMDYVDEPVPGDDKMEDKGVTIFIDPKAVLFLLGTEMDYVTEKLSSQFVFNNPNQVGQCGCGLSVEIKPADLDKYVVSNLQS